MKFFLKISLMMLSVLLLSCSSSRYEQVDFIGVESLAINGLRSVDMDLKLHNATPSSFKIKQGEVVVSAGSVALFTLTLLSPLTVVNSGEQVVCSSWVITIKDPALLSLRAAEIFKSIRNPNISYRLKVGKGLLSCTLRGENISLPENLQSINAE